MTRTVPVGEFVALVDDDDYDLVVGHAWYPYVEPKGNCVVYAKANVRKSDGNRTTTRMHSLILPGCRQIDHANGNGLDNRKQNLRPATSSQNGANARKRRGDTSSQYKGVVLRRDRMSPVWRAHIRVNKHRISLGQYSTEEDAARAYDIAALQYFGEFALLNFPTSRGDETVG